MAQERFAPVEYSTEFDPEAFARQIKQQAAAKKEDPETEETGKTDTGEPSA